MESLDGVSPTRIGKDVAMLFGELRKPLYVRSNYFQKLEDTLGNVPLWLQTPGPRPGHRVRQVWDLVSIRSDTW